MDCSSCGAPGRCRPDATGVYLCEACARIKGLEAGRVVRGWPGPTPAAHSELLRLHLAATEHVQVYLVPQGPSCLLVLARVILWRKFGVIAGLLPGPPAGTHWYSNGARVTDAARLAAHVHATQTAAPPRWPLGTAPVLVTGCRQPLALTLPGPELDRVRFFKDTLSEHGANASATAAGMAAGTDLGGARFKRELVDFALELVHVWGVGGEAEAALLEAHQAGVCTVRVRDGRSVVRTGEHRAGPSASQRNSTS